MAHKHNGHSDVYGDASPFVQYIPPGIRYAVRDLLSLFGGYSNIG